MLRTINSTGWSTILQSLIDAVDKDEVDERSDDETNLSNLSAYKKSTEVGYLTPKSTKKGIDNLKKSIKAAKGFDYLTPDAKKVFNHW